MFTLVSSTLYYPYGTGFTVSEPPAQLYLVPTATSITVVLDKGFRFAAEPLNWVATQGGFFKQIKDLTKADRLLTLLPSTTAPYTPFGSTMSSPIVIQQRSLYRQVTSTALSSTNAGLPINTTIPIQTLAPSNRCFCLISDTDCKDGGNLIPTPVVTIV